MTEDRFGIEMRSHGHVMKTVGKRDTAPELRLRFDLRRTGLRCREHPRIANPEPDFAFVGSRLAIFVDGYFRHGRPRHYVVPVGNAAFRQEALRSNRARDRIVNECLKIDGWKVFRLWECEVNSRLLLVTECANQLVEQRNARKLRGAPHVRHT